jgi:putative selenate reductase
MPDGRHEILHVDRMCNECGNCAIFCPYDSAPYRDKFTLFFDRAGFDETPTNQGFLPLGGTTRSWCGWTAACLRGGSLQRRTTFPPASSALILTVLTKYRYLLG